VNAVERGLLTIGSRGLGIKILERGVEFGVRQQR
jgi:hypothetical protein